MLSLRPFQRAADAAVVFIGLWQAWAMLVTQLGGSFHTLLLGLVGLLPLTAWCTVQLDEPGPPASRRWVGGVLLIGLVAAVCTAVLVRPDGDDAFYVGQITGTLAHPDLAVSSFDVLHGDVTVPIQQPAHQGQSYELLVAAAAWLLPVDHRTLYYLVFPALWAALGALAMGLLARLHTDDDGATVAMGAWLVLLLAWAGTHVTPANYGLVRLFQGKGVFVTVWMPLVVLAAHRFGASPDRRSWTRLLCAVFGAASFTSTGLVVAPVGAALAVLPRLRADARGIGLALAGLGTALPSLAVLFLVKRAIDAARLVPHGVVSYSLWQWLGDGLRPALALGLFALLPLCVTRERAWARVYVGAVLLLLFNGISGDLLARVSDVLAWRIYWAVPILPLMALSVGAASRGGWRRGVTGALLLGFCLAGPWVGSTANRAEVVWPPRPDQDPDACSVAAEVVAHDVEHLALLERTAAMCATAWVDRPPLLAVRQFYTRHLERHHGPAETRLRLDGFRFTLGQLSPARAEGLLDELDERCATSLAVRPRATQRYGRSILTHGWRRHPLQAGLHLYTRDDCP